MKSFYLFKTFNSAYLPIVGACLFFLFSTSNNLLAQGEKGNKKEYTVKSKDLKTNWKAINADMEIEVTEITQEIEMVPVGDSLPEKKNSDYPADKIERKTYRLKANEVEKIHPGLVQYNLNGDKYIDYNSLITILLKTLQEQDKRISDLEKQVKKEKIK